MLYRLPLRGRKDAALGPIAAGTGAGVAADWTQASIQIDAIRRACEPYARQPLIEEPRKEFGPDIRSFSHTRNYIVIYRVLDDGIDVLRVIHTARKWWRVFRYE